MERTQAAERMNAVERMAAGVAGELSDALNVICGSSERISQQLQLGETVELESVQAMIKSGQRASALTNQLLAIGQRQPGTPTVCDLGVLVADVTEMIPPMLGRDIFVSSHNQVGLGRVRADAEQIREALIQLALHARDAMPHGGKLEFETSNEFVDAPGISGNNPPQLGAYVRLVVRDSGGGLDDDDLRHILEPYYSPRRNRQQSDAELRLSVVNGVVRQNGGFLSVDSRIRVGSTFTMYFPRVDVKNWLDEVMRDPLRVHAANVAARRRASLPM
jgi:signal transduction histidine kinase